ncbi:MAG: hypothetical protein IJF80_01455 [Clostridia bacterium]|nr:hypothetical protein [Clostridia bacterium]
MKCALKAAAILLVCIIAGFALLCGVFLLPTEPMFENAKESADVFEISGEYPYFINGYDGSMLDNYTDSLMLLNAVTDSDEGLINRAANMYRATSDESPVSSLLNYLETGETSEFATYERYWHGYLVTLKPMLMLFNYGQIRIINLVLFALLGLFVFVLMLKKTGLKYAIGFIFAILFTIPIVIPFSLQFSTVMYITLCALCVMLLFHEKLEKNNRYIYFFLIAGVLTSYMDYLTYPLVVLGVPMVVLMLLKKDDDLKNKITRIILYSVCFGIGYVGMWAGKVVLGSLLTGNDIIGNALSAFAERSGNETANAGTITVIDVFARNLGMIGEIPFIILAVGALLVEAVLIAIKGIPFKKALINALPFLLIACMPFAWQVVTSNHSYIHAWFTYRMLWIMVFAIITMLSSSFDFKKKSKKA